MLTREKFATEFAGLCEVFERTPTLALIEAYYNALSDLTDDQFNQAVAMVLRHRKYNKLPMPHELREGIMPDIHSSALLALDSAEKAAERYGAYKSVVFDDPVIHAVIQSLGGWPKFCRNDDGREWHWIQKDFVKLYETFARNLRPDIPLVLTGICDRDNSSAGRLEWLSEPKVIGDTERAKAWQNKLTSREYAALPGGEHDKARNGIVKSPA